METMMNGLELARRGLFRTGPYVLLAIVLPGGTLLALLPYWYQRHPKKIIRALSI